MSVNRPSRATDDDIKITKLPSERAYTSEQHPIDRRLKHLKEDVLPLYPFLLTVPTDVPFRLGSRFVNNWAVGNDGPFSPEEHQLQYMTFLTHHEGDSLLVAVGDWSDGTGNVMSDQQSGLQGAAGTPWSGPVKKKISLNDYKNKRKTGASPSPIGQEASSHHLSMDIVLEDSQRAPKVSTVGNNIQKSSDKIAASRISIRPGSETLERKRPAESELENARLQERKGAEMGLKKPKLSVEAEAELNKSGRSKVNGLPTLLSPTLPPTSSSPKLPRLLSPTLPPNIEKELARFGEETLVSDPTRTKNAPNGDALRTKTQKTKSSDLSTSCIDSTLVVGRQSLQSKYSNSVADKRPSTTQGSMASSFSETPTSSLRYQTDDKPNSYGKSAKPQLLMKLKYGRANRKRIEALLKFSGKRKVAPPGSPAKNIADPDSVLIKRPSETIKATASEYPNPRIYRSEGKTRHVPSSQAPKNAGSEKPQTPVSSTLSTITHNQEKTKQASATPVKDLKNSTYGSENVGNDGRTSSQPTGRYPPGDSVTGVKQSVSQVNLQPSTSRNGERRAWKDEYQKYGNLGRELKHAAERHTARDCVTDVDEKLAAATAIEAILCFILAFVADDQSKTLSRQISDSSSWLSILAYWRVVKKNSAPFPQLHSLCLILGATSYDAIHALDLERFAVTPLPGEHTPVPTPGSDGNTVVSDESKKNRREILELKSRLPQCYKESQRLWLEGSQGLSEDILVHEFPDTWSRRSRNFSEQGKQCLKPGDYSGEFFLPLGRMTTPVETVRFGYSILREWCKKEGVEWNGRLCL